MFVHVFFPYNSFSNNPWPPLPHIWYASCVRHQSVVFSCVLDIKVLFSQVCSTSKCRLLRCPRHQSIVFSYVLDIKVSASQVSSTSKCLFSGVFNIKVSSSHVFSTSKCSFLRCLKHQSEVLSLLLGSISTSKCF